MCGRDVNVTFTLNTAKIKAEVKNRLNSKQLGCDG
jgi:hypothetical protein